MRINNGCCGEHSWPQALYVRVVGRPAQVVHEEHKPVTLAPGLYRVQQAREFDYIGQLARWVAD